MKQVREYVDLRDDALLDWNSEGPLFYYSHNDLLKQYTSLSSEEQRSVKREHYTYLKTIVGTDCLDKLIHSISPLSLDDKILALSKERTHLK
jgi:hypothetical protein